MGTPEFAVPSLRALARAHEVAAVFTQPDRPRRRGKDPIASPVKDVAVELGIPVYQPATLRDPVAASTLREHAPEVICVAAYGLLLPREVLDIPPLGCLNVHASLLPRHRGAAPIHHAILQGDVETGVAIMLMEEGLDTGPFTSVRRVEVSDKDLPRLTAELAEEGAQALLETLEQLEAGTVEWMRQDDSRATYAHKVEDVDLALHPELTTEQALRRVRASSASARSKMIVCGKRIDVIAATESFVSALPGRIVFDGTALVAGFSDGAITLDTVRAEGKRPIEGHAFACGARPGTDARWEPV